MEKMDVIKKLKALSDRGINGEKENATKLLNKLMKKYGITIVLTTTHHTRDSI